MVFLFGFSHVIFLLKNWNNPENANSSTFLTQIATLFDGLIGNLQLDIMSPEEQRSNSSAVVTDDFPFKSGYANLDFVVESTYSAGPKIAAVFFIIMCTLSALFVACVFVAVSGVCGVAGVVLCTCACACMRVRACTDCSLMASLTLGGIESDNTRTCDSTQHAAYQLFTPAYTAHPYLQASSC
jgi:hypothetical protein